MPRPSLAQPASVPSPAPALAAPQAPLDVPTTLVSGEPIQGFTLVSPKVFWYTTPTCTPTANAPLPVDAYSEAISRIASYGSEIRRLFYRFSSVVGTVCGQQSRLFRPTSNMIADANYVYWLESNGLKRLSTNANPGDPIGVLNASAGGSGELAQNDTEVFVLTIGSSTSQIRRIRKSDGALLGTFPTISSAASSRLSTDGTYVYVVVSGALRRYTPSTGVFISLATGVTAYFAEKPFSICFPSCINIHDVFIAKTSTVVRYSNISGTTSNPIYTSTDNNPFIFGLTYGGGRVMVFERRVIPCPDLFCSANDVLYRIGRSGGTPALLYSVNTGLGSDAAGLTNDGTFVYWLYNGIQRLPIDAAALPVIDMQITGMEVTQGVQDLQNTVPLVKNRRTFVRLYVKASSSTVPGVTARLSKIVSGNVVGNPLLPINSVGTKITVKSSPGRNNLNDSFLFELPLSWTTANLTIRADLNPYHLPLETSYGADNTLSRSLTFLNSPRLEVQFVAWGYTLPQNNQTYYPRFIKDIIQTYSWVRRAYPLATTPGFLSDPGPGFRPNLWFVYDPDMGALVDRSDSRCATWYPKVKDRSLCASRYANIQMDAMRTENGISANRFFYGMIYDTGISGTFPRGQACCATKVSTGPVGPGTWGWDFDGSYADWYAGHEIGHTLGRAHPAKNSDDPATPDVTEGCGQSRSDLSYPYDGALISPADGRVEGFDPGDVSLSVPRAIYPGTMWADVMSYCNNQWLSDYTYKAMYNFMIANPLADAQAAPAAAPQVDGDFLSVFGTIMPAANVATFDHLSHLSSVAVVPPIAAGNYAIRLLNAQDGVLASYAFTPEAVEDTPTSQLSFGQVVNFVAGTTRVQIVKLDTSAVLASASISANPPALSNVNLQSASNPVTGTATLSWTASDPDGDPLSFDVLYSRDSGATFQPLMMNIATSSNPIDTTQLGGGSAIIRVIASDGINSVQADSAPFTMANKPPQPRIESLADGQKLYYGQMVNLSGDAFDLQDSGVDPSGLVWRNQYGIIGRGSAAELDDLPAGQNVITLTATNSAGLSRSTSVTVLVDDDLDLLGPTLTAGPMQLGWHLEPGATAPQVANITITNSGDGTLTWTASESASWLSLGAASGTAPSTLTVTANPTGMPAGKTASTTIQLVGSDGTTLAIPVSLGIGDVLGGYGSTAGLAYIPLLMK
jgi:hypothetical protein